ncbi:hypothetical protein Sjap_008044 [Stephania japonica]|uniref:Uncharacterized protein n=1 Tax=Stephania japonica TaxID=461633 RepID=A0AAP0JPK1_9MAGN
MREIRGNRGLTHLFIGEFEDEENYVNFDTPPKFDDDNQGFIEDMVVFRDEGLVVMNIQMSTSSQVQAMVNDATVIQCSVEVVAKT